jgi:hypothetical protein
MISKQQAVDELLAYSAWRGSLLTGEAAFEDIHQVDDILRRWQRCPSTDLSDYRSKKWPHAVRIEHDKNKTLIWHPLEEIVDGELIKFYAEAEDILSHLPKIGVPMIMRKVEKGDAKGTAKVWSYPGMEKLVQQLRKKIDGVSELFTLDACRHGGMTELKEAELTEGQGRALSGHKTAQAYRGYAKETMQRALAATRKRHAHLIAQKQVEEQSSKEFPNGGRNQFPNTFEKSIENRPISRKRSKG